jgi:hypothetical protein
VRYCGECKLNVYNISALTRPAAEKLILDREGRLCLRYYQRRDGTIIMQDCPVAFRRMRWVLARLASVIAAVLVILAAGRYALLLNIDSQPVRRLRVHEPFGRVAAWLEGPVPIAPPAAPNLFVLGTRLPPGMIQAMKDLEAQSSAPKLPNGIRPIGDFPLPPRPWEEPFWPR